MVCICFLTPPPAAAAPRIPELCGNHSKAKFQLLLLDSLSYRDGMALLICSFLPTHLRQNILLKDASPLPKVTLVLMPEVLNVLLLNCTI